MKLYHNPASPYSRKVLTACYEKGIEFDGEIVNLMDPEARKAYVEVNPLCKVPFLVRDDGWKIPESSIIIEYLDTTFADKAPKLIPSDPELARQVRFHDRMADLYLIEPAGRLFFENMKPESERNAKLMEGWNWTLQTTMPILDTHLESKKFIMGDDFTMGDLGAMSGTYLWHLLGRNLSDFPHIRTWWESVSKRPSWQRVEKEAAPMLKQLGG